MKFKPIYWHFISIAIICFLSFQYWSKATLLKSTCASLNGINVQLQNDREVINSAAHDLKSTIGKIVEVNPVKYVNYKNKTEKADGIVNTALLHIDDCKKQFADYCGGWDTTKHELKYATSNSNTAIFFNNHKIQEIKSQILTIINSLTDIDNNEDKVIFLKKNKLKNLLNNDKYWNRLQSLPHINAYIELSNIENTILSDKIFFLNYMVNMFSIDEPIRLDKFRVVLTPKKVAPIEGEEFESDIYITKYSSTLWDGTTITVNGENMSIINGVAHYKSAPQSIGKKIVKFNATLSNPTTGEVSTSQGEYEFEVLPKCSRDCTPLSKK